MYNILLNAGHMSKCFYRKHQMTHFLRPLLLWQCKHVLQNGGQAFLGEQLRHFQKCVIWYWCDRDTGQSYGNTKNCNIDNKNQTHTHKHTHTHTIKSHLKKSFKLIRQKCIHIYDICLPPKIETLSEQKMHTHTALELVLPDIDCSGQKKIYVCFRFHDLP